MSFRLSPTLVYILAGFILGAPYLFVTGPFQAPDEYVHFYRAFDVSEGNLRAQVFHSTETDPKKPSHPTVGGQLPASIQTSAVAISAGIPFYPEHKMRTEHIRGELSRALDENERSIADYYPSAKLPALSYVPQALGIGLGRFFDQSPLGLLYFSRTANFIFAWVVTLMSLALIHPFGWSLTLIVLSPMALFMAASCSPDAMINAAALGCCACFLALKIDVSRNEVPIRSTLTGFLVFCALLLLSGKAPLIFLLGIFLSFLFTRKLPFSDRLKIIAGLAASAAAAALLLNWTSAGIAQIPDARLNADPAGQLRVLITTPADFLQIIWNSVQEHFVSWTTQFVGTLGWLDTQLPASVHYTWLVAFLGALWLDITRGAASRPQDRAPTTQFRLTGLDSLLVVATVLFTSFVLIASVYILFNAIGTKIVWGVQGRYFIPIVLFLSLLIYSFRVDASRYTRTVAFTVFVLTCVAHVLTLQTLFARYYAS